jgi:uncharacterized protein (DUF736 family)
LGNHTKSPLVKSGGQFRKPSNFVISQNYGFPARSALGSNNKMKECIMHTVGQLTYNIEADEFKGRIASRSFTGKVVLKKVSKRSAEAPDYAVFDAVEGYQTGSVWLKKFNNKEGSFLSITLDNDGMVQPLHVTAFPQDDNKNTLDVIWKREKVINTQKTATSEQEAA